MEWMAVIGNSIRYIEGHITDALSINEIANTVNISSFYFQKGFAMLCGYTVAEYIRNRRLSLAASELISTDVKVIDLALKYGYDSPDSFTKAFTRFHDSPPAAVRRDALTVKTFTPLKIKFSLEGGCIVDYKIENEPAFTVLANAKALDYEGAVQAVPKLWQEHFASGKGATVHGTFGINIDEKMGRESFEYLIADPCAEDAAIPKGFVRRTVPALTWEVFPCEGAMPTGIQSVSRRIYTEWLPQAKEYEFAASYCVEFYDDPSKYKNGTDDDNYYCELWIPVKKK